jgi:peroxiredoxin
MSERDSVAVLLKTLDQPATPRREFSDALRQRLLTDLADANGHHAWVPRLTLPPPPHRRRALAVALAVVLLAGALAAVLLSRPSQASALDLIRKAQRQAASVPPFEATVRYDLNPDGSKRKTVLTPKGATETWQLSYGGPTRFRNFFASQHLQVPGARPVGSYDVLNGHRTASYNPKNKTFSTSTLSARDFRYFAPLGDLTWQGGYPDWEQVCRGPAAQVLPETRVAGRDARHIRCTDVTGNVWQLWIDRETGLVLRLEGQTGGEDVFFDSVPDTSQKGGYTITRLRYNPTFPPGTFKIAKPRGATSYQAQLKAAAARVPPFEALISTRYANSGTRTERVWWLNNTNWRAQELTGKAPSLGGPGSFIVSAHGSVNIYDANDNSYGSGSPNANPIDELLPVTGTHATPTACPIVGHDRIAARPAVQHRCNGYDVWIDSGTGLILQDRSPHYRLRVSDLHYHPTFPAGTFHFERPRGSHSDQQRANDPYFKTKLRPGEPAPNWRAPLLKGGTFQITDLRGKPALLLFFADWCGAAGCIPTNVYTPLERLYRQTKSRLAIVWVDIEGGRAGPAQARKVVRHNHLTFPVVNDNQGPGMNHSNSLKAWRYQAFPYWVLLDSHGRVIEARLKPQTLAQLQQLVHEAK